MNKLNNQQNNNKINNKGLSHDQLVLLEKAENKKNQKDFKGAIEILNEVLYDDPGCIPALEELADNQLSLGEEDKSLGTANFILTLDKNSYTANYLAGFISSRKNDYKSSIEFLSDANKLRPNNPEILRCYGWSLFMSGATGKGIALIERAKNLLGNDPQILNDLAVCMIETGNIEKGIDLISEIQDIDPGNKRAEHTLLFLKNNQIKK